MKKWKIVALTGITALSLAACSTEAGSDSKVVVETKSGNITEHDLYNEMKAKYGAEILDTMIQEKILFDKYKITDKDVEKRLKYVKLANNVKSDKELETLVVSTGGFKTLKEYKETIKLSIAKAKELTKGVSIKEADVKKAYEEQKTQVSASHILVADKKTADEVYAKIQKGEDFADLVSKYSTDTSTSSNGGSLGYFTKGSMVQAFEDTVFKMKKGEISKPVKTDYGYHIIRLDDKIEFSYEDLKPMLEEDLKLQKVGSSFSSVYTKLKDSYKVEVKDDQLKNDLKELEETQNAAATSASATQTAN
ncbi:peptidylprolyl isomerase [Priestia megaterium]|nr:peptidylprolyl isomerase [Priestia megaterium]